jgi:hypothetical protein
LAAELVSINVDVIVTSGNIVIPYARNATATIPIVSCLSLTRSLPASDPRYAAIGSRLGCPQVIERRPIPAFIVRRESLRPAYLTPIF